MWACFLFPFQNKCNQMLVRDDADFSITVQVSLADFTTLFRVVTEILYLRNHLLGFVWGCTWTAFCSIFCMQEHLTKVGVLLERLWQMHKLKIHNWVSRCVHLNISTMYSIFNWKEFELSYRQAFYRESGNNCASEETNGLENSRVVLQASFQLMVCVEIKWEIPFF